MERRMPWKRMQNYLAVVVITISLSLFFSYKNRWLLDEIAAYLILDIVFLAVLLYTLERNRVKRKLGVSGSNRYGRIALCYGVCCLAAIGCYFSPEFTCPAEAFALFLCLAANIEISISLSLLICMLLCVARGQTIYELAAYCILILVGAQMAHTVYKKKTRVWGCMILGSVSLCAPMLFCYLAGVENKIEVFLWKSLYLFVTIALYFAFAKRLYGKMEFDRLRSYERIIDHEYPLFQDIKNYSKAEYVHAMKAGTVALKCATEIGANEMLAAAGGFYYRLGVIEGEPYIENGVRLAEEKCFPLDVIQILLEYNGEQKLPSSKESAIVHMVDACLKKIEMLNSQKLSSSWNQDMVIYQTLNELSASGIYDESGLSMNQFLKVRELLVREEIGYDNNDRGRNSG